MLLENSLLELTLLDKAWGGEAVWVRPCPPSQSPVSRQTQLSLEAAEEVKEAKAHKRPALQSKSMQSLGARDNCATAGYAWPTSLPPTN